MSKGFTILAGGGFDRRFRQKLFPPCPIPGHPATLQSAEAPRTPAWFLWKIWIQPKLRDQAK
jgi:hypothetical protein